MRTLRYSAIILSLLAILSMVALLPSAAAASKTFQPVYNPRLEVAQTAHDIAIDGDLNDPGWRYAGQAGNFVERYPGDQIQPDVETKVYVTYDADNLYVAFVCYDDPTQIRSTMCQRDQFGGDDNVCLLLDTFGDATRAYELFVNPYGIQKDRLWSSIAGEDSGFDIIWHSAAQITDSGYQVEIAVPFSSLRFPNRDVQTWKIDFWRNRPRETWRQYSWAAYDRNEQCWVCQWGTVDGIRDVRPGKGMELLPTFIANQSGNLPSASADFDNGDVMGELSLGAKYSISSDVILDAAYNPDFSQIEGDAAQVDVNSPISLFYPERRPYFQEGQDIFRTLFNSFYTRTVNDPMFTAKLTSRMERTTIGFVSAYDETSPYVVPLEERTITINGGESMVNVLRGLHTVGNDTHFGFILSDRRFKDNGSGTVFGVDGDIRLTRNYSIDGQVLVTHTQEPSDDSPYSFFEGEAPYGYTEDDVNLAFNEAYGLPKFADGKHTFAFDGESYYGTGLITRLRRESRHLNFTFDYNQVSPSYRTQVGFDPYMNYRNFSVYSSYNIYPEKGLFQRLTPQVYNLNRWNFDGLRKLRTVTAGIDGQLRFAQVNFSCGYATKEEMYEGRRYEDLWTASLDVNSSLSNQLSYSAGIDVGRDIAYYQETKGKEFSFYAGLNWKPIDRLLIEPNVNYIKSSDIDSGDKLFQQVIIRSRVGLQVNRQLSLRLVVQYNEFSLEDYYKSRRWEVDPLLTYRLSSFSVFYIGSTSNFRDFHPLDSGNSLWKMTDRQFFMKLQYLFQV